MPQMSVTAAAEAHASRRRKRRSRRKRRRAPRPGRVRLPGPLRARAGRAAAVAGRLRPAPGRGGEACAEGPATARSQSLTRPAARSGSAARRPRTRTATRWRRPTPGATTTSGGSTGWSARTGPLIERMTLVWHDWFATSNDGVGVAAPDDPPERAAAEATRWGRSAICWCGSRATRRCCCGSRASQNTKDSPNENYGARADGAVHARRGPRLHRGRRARAGAGADRLPQRLGRRRRAEQLPLRPRAPRRRHEEASSARRAASTGATRASCASRTRATRRSSSRSCGRTSSRSRRARKTRRALQRLYVRGRYEVRPVVEAILRHPAFYEGPRMVKPPVVYLAGLLRGMRPRRRHRVLDVAVGHDAPAPVLPAERRRAGRTTAGSTPAPGGGAG